MSYRKRNISPVEPNKRFLVETPVVTERIADYKRGAHVNKAFKTMDAKEVDDFYKNNREGTHGNLNTYFIVQKSTKEVVITEGYEDKRAKDLWSGESDYVHLSSAISSSLVLYRLVCMLKQPHVIADGADGYKVPWCIYLKHKKTGAVVCFSEWKGAFGFRTHFSTPEETPKEFLDDIKFVIDLILSNNSPHPYDSTVAGSCA
jgi:hypothetical protein